MEINSNLIRKYPFSWLCIAVIWLLCFCTPPHTPLDNVAFIDKWTHIIMYAGTCAVIWFEYLRGHKAADRKRLFVWAWLAPVLMSGLIEILQEYCTGGRRSGDWIDFAANTTGATVVGLIGIIYLSKRKKY